MSVLFTRNLLLISMSVLACLSSANEDDANSDDSVEAIYKFNIVHYNRGPGKSGWVAERELVATSKDLITEVSKLPKKFIRPESLQNIFRQGEWALITDFLGNYIPKCRD